jgi:DNA-binding transcriptional MerR regulator
MRMAALSEASGVPVPTIKFYLREGLLPRGDVSVPNQASYSDLHVRRLRLIRALIEVGGITVAAAREVLDALDSDLPVEHTFGIAQQTVSERIDPADVPQAALDAVDAATPGWRVHPDNPGRLAAARALSAFERAGQQDLRGWVERYAAAALQVAEADLDEVDARPGREAKAEIVVVGTALGDALFSGLRRAAQEHVSATRYLPSPSSHTTDSPNPTGA